MDFSGVLQALGAGGDVAVIALLFVMWKFDRRLLKLEIHVCKEEKSP